MITRQALAISTAVGLSTLLLLNWNAGWYEQYWMPTVYVGAALLLANRVHTIVTAVVVLTIATGLIGSYGGRGIVLPTIGMSATTRSLMTWSVEMLLPATWSGASRLCGTQFEHASRDFGLA